jgi:preprotein translocase subunit YajC
MAFIPLLQTAQTGSLFMPILTFGLVFVIFYFFIIRPQNKKQKDAEKMIAALKKGDRIITIGGIHGVVTSTKDQSVIVKVDDNCKMEFSRSAISSVVTDKSEKAEKTSKDEKTEVLPENTAEASAEKDSEEK